MHGCDNYRLFDMQNYINFVSKGAIYDNWVFWFQNRKVIQIFQANFKTSTNFAQTWRSKGLVPLAFGLRAL